MSRYPAPTREAHATFCELEGWELVRNATGGGVRHHLTYQLTLGDGRVLRTRVSRPPDRTTYGARIWAHILRDQLEVAEDEFWALVQHRERPDRGVPPTRDTAIPVELLAILVNRLHYSDADARAMGRQAAIERVNQYWTTGE